MSLAYRERIVGDIRLQRPIKLVVDCGNGVAGASTLGIERAIGCEVQALHSEVDAIFRTTIPTPASSTTCAM